MFDGEKSRHAQDLGRLLELKGIVEFRFAAICGLISHGEEFGPFLFFFLFSFFF